MHLLTGPSPRAWGKHDEGRGGRRQVRTIPTRVGKTSDRHAARLRLPDHPHARGENSSVCGLKSSETGPSPRAWGKPIAAKRRCLSGRTIPTRVGKTRPRRRLAACRSDHPHARGENGLPGLPLTLADGPSPRPWGKRVHRIDVVDGERTIPTPVGKPGRRRRGGFVRGPSPRAWGKRNILALGHAANRTIPTRVGKTRCPEAWACGSTDHPHPRGENVFATVLHKSFTGPSPPAWGKLHASL